MSVSATVAKDLKERTLLFLNQLSALKRMCTYKTKVLVLPADQRVCLLPQFYMHVEKQRRFFVDNLMLGVQLADISTRCSSHPQG